MTVFHCLVADLHIIQTYTMDYHHKRYLSGLEVKFKFLTLKIEVYRNLFHCGL